jgi:Tol biopolymer transport system component
MSVAKPKAADFFRACTYVWFPDGTIRRMSPTDGFYIQACIHPEGREAIFWGGPSGPPRIWQYDFANATLRPLTPPEYGCMHPSYSWDGSQIVFVSDQGHDQLREDATDIAERWQTRRYGHPAFLNLFVMDRDGGNARQITRGRVQDERPCLSPDGKTAAFISNRSEQVRLWSVPTHGSEAPTLLQKDGWADRPWYSLDGAWIFFYSEVGGQRQESTGLHQICRIPAGGGAWEPLANDNLGRSHGPYADLDGEHVWFHATISGRTNIYKLSLLGGDPVRIDPPGFQSAAHATRASNGIMTFDASCRVGVEG